MNKVSIDTKQRVTVSVNSQFLGSLKKSHTWFTTKIMTTLFPVFLLAIDACGFFQVASATLYEDDLSKALIVSGFVVAFEVAPIYMGYAMCLKNYKLGKPIHKKIFRLAFAAFLFGVVANVIYRVFTMHTAYSINPSDTTLPETAIPLTVVLCILPVITSFISIIMGCLSFDPLLYDIHCLSKKLKILKEKRRQLNGFLQKTTNDNTMKQMKINMQDQYYDNTKAELLSAQTRLKNFVSMCCSFNS